MKFVKQTLFDLYNISTNLKQGEILRLFQTNANLRKVLPQYIKTINDKKLLAIEKLFSITQEDIKYDVAYLKKVEDCDTLSSQQKLALLIGVVCEFDNALIQNISGKKFNKLLQNLQDLDFASISDGVLQESTKMEFIDCVLEELTLNVKRVVNELNSKKTNALYRIICGIEDVDIKQKLTTELIDCVVLDLEQMNNINDNDAFATMVKYIVSLNKNIYSNADFYIAYKAVLNSDNFKNEQKYHIANKYFNQLIKILKPEDQKSFLEILINAVVNYLSFDNIEKYDYHYLSQEAEFMQTNIECLEDLSIKTDNSHILQTFVNMLLQGEQWYSEYVSLVSQLKNNQQTDSISNILFNLCVKLKNLITTKDKRTLFVNMIVAQCGFDKDFAIMEIKMSQTQNLVDKALELGQEISYAMFSQIGGDKIITPTFVDTLIYRYYPIVILDSDYATIFDNLKLFCLSAPLKLMELVRDRYTYTRLNSKGVWLVSMLQNMPSDWDVYKGTNVKSKLAELGYYNSQYGISKSKTIVDKCNAIIKRPISTSTSRTSSYRPIRRNADNSNNTSSTNLEVKHPGALACLIISIILTIAGFASGTTGLGVIGLIAGIISFIYMCQE